MDEAAKGAAALSSKDFAAAIKHYTAALTTHPQAVDYYIKRSTAHTRASPANPLLALFDAETAVVLARARGKRELIAQAQLRRGVALFAAERYGDAGQCFSWARKLSPNERSLDVWDAKVAEKTGALEEGDERREVRVVETPDVNIEKLGKEAEEEGKKVEAKEAAPVEVEAPKPPERTPANKIRHDWYQSADTVTVSLMAKGVPKDEAKVDIESDSISITFPLATGSDYHFSLDPLFQVIDPATSSYKIMSTKVEFILKKATPGQKWKNLEASEPPPQAPDKVANGKNVDASRKVPKAATDTASKGVAYPSSSKSGPKNWDKLATELTKKPKKAHGDKGKGKGKGEEEEEEDAYLSDDEGDAVNSFFKKLYKDADPDTRRAMMKSYQESNGTALSTNWTEVKKGTVETSPPDGMEAKKWS